MIKRSFKKICCLLFVMLSFVVALTGCSFNQKTKYKIEFVVDGEIYATVKTYGEETIEMPEDPTKEGYIFDGWYCDQDVWEELFTADSLINTPLSANMSVYAKWEEENTDPEDPVDPVDPEDPEDPADPTDPSNNTQAEFERFEKTGDHEYSLKVSNSTKKLFLRNLVTVDSASTWTLSTDADGNQMIENKSMALEVGDNTYYVTVTAEDGSTQLYTLKIRRKPIYDVVFDVAGGVSVEAQQVEEGELAQEPETTKIGYELSEWNFDFTTPITENKTIVASWTLKEYTITYNLAGGSVATDNPDTYTIESGEITLTNPTREGYTFVGWTGTELSASTTTVTIVTGSTGNREYVANWHFEEIEDASQKQIVYDMDEASKPILETAPEGVNVSKVCLVSAEDTSAMEDVTQKTRAGDAGVFTEAEARTNTTKTLVYFDENNVAYPIKTRFVTKIIDDEAELRKALEWDATTTTTISLWGYHLLSTDVTVTAPLTTSAARTIKYGTLDGDGHKITVSAAETFRGLFGTALTKVNVKNMQIDLTRDFGDGTANTNYQVVLAHNADEDCNFTNLNLHIKRADGDTTPSRLYSNKYYLNLTAQSLAKAQNVTVYVADGVLQRADESDVLPFIVQGFNKSSSLYIFSSEATGYTKYCKLYPSVSDAVLAGEQFLDLQMSGYWMIDKTNSTLMFGKTAYLATMNTLSAKLQEQGIRNVSFLGDSITTFSGWSNSTSYNSTIGDNAVHYTTSKTESIASVNDVWWKQLLNMTNTNLCVNNAYSGDQVVNRAVSRSLQLHRDGDEIVNPDMIFVYLGVNDFNHSVDVQTFKETYDTMIKGMLEKYTGAKIYVGTIMPNARRVAPTVLDEFNAAIREIAEKYNVGLIDFYNDSGITADNMATYYWETTASQRLHPNALGMDVMTQTVLNKLIEDYIG